METTIEALLAARPIFQRLATVEMAARDSYLVFRMIQAIDKEYEGIEKAQQKLIEKYGSKDESGHYMTNEKGGVLISPTLVEGFSNEIKELYQTKIILEVTPLDINVFGDLKLTPVQMYEIQDFIV